MSTLDDLNLLLDTLDAKVDAHIEGSLLASTDGFLITSTLQGDDADQVAAMAATTTGVGRRMADALQAGELSETTVSGTDRLVLLYRVGAEGVLVVVAHAEANVALINMAAREAAQEAGGLIAQVVSA
jgi:hypothetical protein